jgi:hypothetical protein
MTRQLPRSRLPGRRVAQSASPAGRRLAVEPVATNGAYYNTDRPTRSSGPSYDTAVAARLWQLTEQICGAFTPAQ